MVVGVGVVVRGVVVGGVVVGVGVVVRIGSNGFCAFMQFRPSLLDVSSEEHVCDMVMDMSLS